MSTAQEYCRKLNTDQLALILRNHLTGTENYPMEVILDICSVLTERGFAESHAWEILQEFYEHDCPEEEKDL